MRLSWRQAAALRVYQAAMHVGLPVGLLVAFPWLLAKTKRRRTVFRRLGFQSLRLPEGDRRPLWVHALSLGETLSCVTLVKTLRQRLKGRPLVFSVSTLAAREMAEERLRSDVDRLVYFPFDLVPSVGRMLRGVDPAMVVVVETDIWPGFQRAVACRQIPAALVNARLSPQSLRSCRRLKALFAPALNAFESVFPQSEGEADRYREVGVLAEKIGPVGNLKFDAVACDMSEEADAALRVECGIKVRAPVWLAGSTHPGEEKVVLEVFRRVREFAPQLQLVLVPRHPRRGAEVRHLCQESGLGARLFSEQSTGETGSVLVVDAMGRLAALYRLADVAFVGGSLAPKGGQNPIEPAAAGKPVVFGPDMSDFPDIARELLSRGAAYQVGNSRELLERMKTLLGDAALARRMGLAGAAFVTEHRGATRRVADWIVQRLDSRQGGGSSQSRLKPGLGCPADGG